MSRYSFADSIRDGATLPLIFEPVPVDLHVNQDVINAAFEELTAAASLTREEKSDLARRVRMEAIMKSPERIRKVCEHIANHFLTKIDPNGFKGQVVCYDRECCLLYKQELDKLLGEYATTIVMDTNNDKEDRYKQWRRDRDEEAKLLDCFRDPHHPLKIVIVTSKLLTGFDAPILLRLSQCTGGYIRNDDGGDAQQISTAKLEALEDIIDSNIDAGKKVVVFARFVPEIDAISRMLTKKSIGHAIIKGDVTDRAEQVQAFQKSPDVKVFIGQLATTGMGLTLTAGTVAVYYSLDFSYANYEQSRARIRRIGQTQRGVYIHLVAKGTIDEHVMSALQHKGDIAKMVVDDYKRWAIRYSSATVVASEPTTPASSWRLALARL